MSVSKALSLILSLVCFNWLSDAAGTSESRTPSPKLSTYELTMEVDPNAAITADISITVFWNDEVYQSTIEAPSTTGVYTFYAFESFMYNDYNVLNPVDKVKMLIQNNINNDAAVFTSIKLTAEDGDFVGAQSFCAVSSDVGTYYNDQLVRENNQCEAGYTNYGAVCVDHTPDTQCNPANLLIYFDKSRPNTLIENALIENAEGLLVEGCQMVVTPNNARKCARKTINECGGAGKCALITKDIGSENGESEGETENLFYRSKKSKIFTIDHQWKNNGINKNVLFLLIAISLGTNLYFVFCGSKKRKLKLATDSMTVITPLLEGAV